MVQTVTIKLIKLLHYIKKTPNLWYNKIVASNKPIYRNHRNSSTGGLTCYKTLQASHYKLPNFNPVLVFFTVCTAECADLPKLLPSTH